MCRALEQNSTATNRQLSAVVRGKVAARTVSDYLARADSPFTTKVIQDQEPEELSEEWTGRGAAVVGGCEEDSLGQTDAMKTRLQSLRTKLRNEGEHGGEHPSFERDLATPQSTRCMYTQSGVVCCIGTFRTETQTRKRLNVLQLMRWER